MNCIAGFSKNILPQYSFSSIMRLDKSTSVSSCEKSLIRFVDNDLAKGAGKSPQTLTDYFVVKEKLSVSVFLPKSSL